MPRRMAKRNDVSQSIVRVLCTIRLQSKDTAAETTKVTENTVKASTITFLTFMPGILAVSEASFQATPIQRERCG